MTRIISVEISSVVGLDGGVVEVSKSAHVLLLDGCIVVCSGDPRADRSGASTTLARSAITSSSAGVVGKVEARSSNANRQPLP